jgi:hypothetical protein
MKRQWLGWKYALLIIGLVVLALLVMDFNSRMEDLRRLRDQQVVVAREVTQMVETQSSLETQIAFATSEGAVERWAYVEGHWVRQGDQPVVPLAPPGSTPEATPPAQPTSQPASNWQVWISLFFDQPEERAP